MTARPELEARDRWRLDVSLLEEAHNVFRRWLGEDYDIDALDALLCAFAAERLEAAIRNSICH